MCGGERRPPPYRALRRRIHLKPVPFTPTLRLMLRRASMGMYLIAACAMARLGASWLAYNGLRRVWVGGALSPMWHHIFFKPAPCATTLRLMLRCASVGMNLTAACAMAWLGASWLTHNGLRRVVVCGALPPTLALRRRIHFKPALCARALRPMRRCASAGV